MLVFHSALAPYRVDFFNAIAKEYDCRVVFLTKNLLSQKIDQEKLARLCNFEYSYMKYTFVLKGRKLSLGYLYYILKYKPDIVIGGEYGLSTIFPLLYKRLLFKKYEIYTICDDSVKIAEECKGVRKFLRNIIIPRISGCIFISDKVALWYKEHVKNVRKCVVFPIINDDAIYAKRLNNIRSISIGYQKKLKLSDKIVFLFVGRLSEVKNLKFLISCFAKVKHPKAKLILVGDGEQKDVLKAQICELNLQDRIVLTGRFDGDELYAWYNLANVLILPSLYEPFGAVTAEALQAGCKVLCSVNAGSSSLIHSDFNGYVFNPHNECELTNKILHYVESECPICLQDGARQSMLKCSFKDFFEKFRNSIV